MKDIVNHTMRSGKKKRALNSSFLYKKSSPNLKKERSQTQTDKKNIY